MLGDLRYALVNMKHNNVTICVPKHLNLTERQAAFIPLFVETGDAYRSAIVAGFSECTARQASAEILDRPSVARAIVFAARQRLARTIPLSISVLEQLRDTAHSEKIRMDCATRLLDRAGIIPPKPEEAVSEIEKPLNDLTLEELRSLVDRYEAELANRAKPINTTPASDPTDLAD